MDKAIEDVLITFFSRYTHLTYEAGENIIRAGDTPRGMYYLEKGVIYMVYHTIDGHEQILNIFRPPCFFPLLHIFTDAPNEYSFEAKTDVSVWRAPIDETVSFIKQNPDVMFDLTSRVFQGIAGQLEEKSALMHGTSRDRLAATLKILTRRFGTSTNGSRTITLKLTHPELAQLSGISRETVTRELGTLKDEGIIRVNKGSITVLDLTKLE